MLVAPDHVTALGIRTHAAGPVPFAICGAGVAVGESASFSESAAAATGLMIGEGYRLVPHMLRAAEISPLTLTGLCK